jgi:hypothetical protein
MSGRCSPTDALNLLRAAFEPKAAAARLTQAIRNDDSFPLYCDGVLVKSHIAATAQVVPKLADDRHWTADIESTGQGLGWARGLNWEFEIDKVKALLPRAETERPWPTVSGSVNWTPPAILASPQPDTREQAMQAAATAAEAARTEAAAARAELERARAELQAATERMERAEAQAQAAEARAETAADNAPRRRPGPKPEHPLWRLETAVFTYRFFRKEKRMPSAGEVAEHLQIKCDGWAPDNSDILKLIRFLHSE